MKRNKSIYNQIKGKKLSPSLYINIGWYLITLSFVLVPYIAIFFAIISLYKSIEVWVWTYEFDDNYIIERKGIIVRNTNRIEYSRIKTINVEQNLLMQIVGISNVRILNSDAYIPDFKFVALKDYKLIEDTISAIIVRNRKRINRAEVDLYNT